MTGVSISPKNNNLEVGNTRQLNVTIEPSNADNESVSFESDDESVATVDSDGIVTAVSEGTTTVTVTTEDGGFTDTATINVTEPEEGD